MTEKIGECQIPGETLLRIRRETTIGLRCSSNKGNAVIAAKWPARIQLKLPEAGLVIERCGTTRRNELRLVARLPSVQPSFGFSQ